MLEDRLALAANSAASPPGRVGGGRIQRLALAGGAYLLGREALGMIIRLLGVIVVVREIGPSAYGAFGAAAAYATVIATVAQMGAEVYLIRATDEPDSHRYNQAFTFLLVTSTAVTVLALGATVAFGSVLRPHSALLPLRLLLVGVPINVLWAPAQACIERRFGFRQMGILEVVGDILLYGTAIPLAIAGAGAWSLVAGYFVWQLWLLVGSIVMSGLRPRWEWSGETVRTLTRHGLSYSSSVWMSRLGALISPIVVGTFVGSAGVGYVAFAQRLVGAVGFAQRGTYRLGMVALSKVSSDDKPRLRYGIEEGSLLQLAVLAVPFAAFGIAARWVVPFVFGREWSAAIPVYSLLAVSAILGGPALVQATLLFSRGKNRDVALSTVLQVGILAVASVLFVHWLGIVGYGLATIVSLIGLIVLDRMVRRLVHFSYRRILPFTAALVPTVLFPIVPLAIAPLLFVPALAVALLPGARTDAVRLAKLVVSSVRKERS